jgi:hypothetical protein
VCIQKFPNWPPGARTANGTALCHYKLYRYFVSQSSEFCHHNPLCCFSTSLYCCKRIFHYLFSPETFGYTLVAAPQDSQFYRQSAGEVLTTATSIDFVLQSYYNTDSELQITSSETHVRHLNDIKPENISTELDVGMVGWGGGGRKSPQGILTLKHQF